MLALVWSHVTRRGGSGGLLQNHDRRAALTNTPVPPRGRAGLAGCLASGPPDAASTDSPSTATRRQERAINRLVSILPCTSLH